MDKDTIYADKFHEIEAFQFDEKVAKVFPDMLKRSVPGYTLIQEMIGVVAKHYSQENSNIYDLGCSLGASSISMLANQNDSSISLIAVDNSKAMIDGCRENVKKFCSNNNIKNNYEVVCEDIEKISFQRASIINLNFTLQFIQPEKRATLLESIYEGLLPGGILILSEKVYFNEEKDELLSNLHHDFKRAQGYSDLEISQKRTALENVLIRDSETQHLERLHKIGFKQCFTWFQCFNFISMIAIKS